LFEEVVDAAAAIGEGARPGSGDTRPVGSIPEDDAPSSLTGDRNLGGAATVGRTCRLCAVCDFVVFAVLLPNISLSAITVAFFGATGLSTGFSLSVLIGGRVGLFVATVDACFGITTVCRSSVVAFCEASAAETRLLQPAIMFAANSFMRSSASFLDLEILFTVLPIPESFKALSVTGRLGKSFNI
jgi:hypothetical protein